jgi:hypothetical protein
MTAAHGGGPGQFSPCSLLSYNADRARLGWMIGCKCTVLDVIVLCIVFITIATMLPDTVDDSSTSTRCLYLSLSQFRLIKRGQFREYSETPRPVW